MRHNNIIIDRRIGAPLDRRRAVIVSAPCLLWREEICGENGGRKVSRKRRELVEVVRAGRAAEVPSASKQQ